MERVRLLSDEPIKLIDFRVRNGDRVALLAQLRDALQKSHDPDQSPRLKALNTRLLVHQNDRSSAAKLNEMINVIDKKFNGESIIDAVQRDVDYTHFMQLIAYYTK